MDQQEPESGIRGAIRSFRALAQSAARSPFGRNAAWFTMLSGAERLAAVVQTIVVSRALGITEYGIYGLLIGTIGFVASVAGLQMGLTATVFVSRHRETDPVRTAGVIAAVHRVALLTVASVVVGALPFAEPIAGALLGSEAYRVAVALGIIFVAASVFSGVQDGIAQGFEVFRALARVKIVAAIAGLVLVWMAASAFGLNGVVVAILASLMLKAILLQRIIRRSRSALGIPARGGGVSVRAIVGGFALPSMAVSLLVGFVHWFGMVLLSRQSGGFDHVAIANTGLQWRGPVLLLAGSLGSVAIPTFSRLFAAGDGRGIRRLRWGLSLANLGMASVLAALMVALSGSILGLYGEGFSGGRVAFSLIGLSTIPMTVANVFLQELVGAGRMWRQLWLHGPYLIALGAGFAALVPAYQAVGYGAALLIGATVLLVHLLVVEGLSARPVRQGGAGVTS